VIEEPTRSRVDLARHEQPGAPLAGNRLDAIEGTGYLSGDGRRGIGIVTQVRATHGKRPDI